MAGRWRVFAGFVAGGIFLLFAHPSGGTRGALGALVALAGLALRGWAAGHLEKGRRLAEDGPYAFFRHPLYSGSFLAAVGFCLAGTGAGPAWHGWLLWATLAALFFGVYPPRILEEEKTLEKTFGDAWRAFVAENRRYLPRLTPRQPSRPDGFQWARYRKNREYQALAGALAGFAALAAKAFWPGGRW